jgi:Ser/Thr protein kinase RdoA (MazF antagonist)
MEPNDRSNRKVKPITLAQASELLSTHYGEGAMLTRLDGDRDANFKVDLGAGQLAVFKVMHPDCPVQNLAGQCGVLQHLSSCSLNLPSVIASRAGNDWEVVTLAGTQRLIWLLNWCPGTLLAHIDQGSAALYASFGEVLARLDNALQGFRPAAVPPGSHWDLTRALEVNEFVGDIEGQSRAIAQRVLHRFDVVTRHRMTALPHSIIHNDANDYNVLVDTRPVPAVVNGLFDFGDLSWQPVICDVAIALTYLILDRENPLEVCAQFLAAYARCRPLTLEELYVLFDLIQTRLVVSIAISSHRLHTEPDNAYLAISQQPAVRTLNTLEKIDFQRALACFEGACF